MQFWCEWKYFFLAKLIYDLVKIDFGRLTSDNHRNKSPEELPDSAQLILAQRIRVSKAQTIATKTELQPKIVWAILRGLDKLYILSKCLSSVRGEGNAREYNGVVGKVRVAANPG
ncbi:hypothetical protein Pfo_022154 [Paulownia fortunei]|nr:hypothetical protein Pfo_022154 [Paulownia fortunei]